MKEPNSKKKRFLQTLKDEIYNYEKEHKNETEEKTSPQQHETELKEEKIIISEEKIISGNNEDNESPIKLSKKKNLQELIRYSKESENEEIEDSPKNNSKENITPINNQNDVANPQKFSSIKYALCTKHGKSYLKIDETNFEIVCKKCVEEGIPSQLEITDKIDNSNNYFNFDEEEQSKYNCFLHQNKKGSFYCDDCGKFVCDMCFADVHKEHKCHLPEMIKKEFNNYIFEEIDNINTLIPILDESVNDVKKISDNLKKQKEDTMKIPQNVLKSISLNNENQIDIFTKKTNEKFMGIDKDVNDDLINYNGIKDKNKKYFEILKKIIDDINKKRNNYFLCGYHKEKMDILNEINNHIKSSFNFINIRLNNTNEKYDQNKEKIENSLNLINKEISNYEKSCISSISTGRENRNIVLLRYIRFVHKEIQYFKNSLIAFASNDDIFLTGLVLSGLHTKRKKNIKQNIRVDANNEIVSNSNETLTTNDENESINDDIKNIIIPIQITIYTMVKKAEGEKLFSKKYDLPGVKNNAEPCVNFYFEKGIKIFKEKLYLIKVENLSDNNYIDLWYGCVGKNNKKNIQVIKCHNTGIEFLFKQAEGLQTDFDEFEQGIIGGILYSKSK